MMLVGKVGLCVVVGVRDVVMARWGVVGRRHCFAVVRR